MTTTYFNTEEDLEEEFGRIEDIFFERTILQERIEELTKDLKEAEKELVDFEEDNHEILFGG